MKTSASKFNEVSTKLLDQGAYQEAEAQFLEATKAEPTWSIPWYNLGLVYKRQKRWEEAFQCNKRATQLDPNDEAAWWNLGIAATALGQWPEARQAWRSYGIPIPEGTGPIEMTNLPLTPIRLNPSGNGEVVWCKRIDPARASIRNVPLPGSGHCYHDLLLHDGEPNGYRQFKGQEVSVFDELEILTRSPYRTYEVKVLFRSLEDVEVLMDIAYQHDLAVEDWGTIRNLCKLCSEGRPHKQHKIDPPSADNPIQLGLAAQNEADLYQIFDIWQGERLGCELVEMACVFAH